MTYRLSLHFSCLAVVLLVFFMRHLFLTSVHLHYIGYASIRAVDKSRRFFQATPYLVLQTRRQLKKVSPTFLKVALASIYCHFYLHSDTHEAFTFSMELLCLEVNNNGQFLAHKTSQ